jgi:hypothetical protein
MNNEIAATIGVFAGMVLGICLMIPALRCLWDTIRQQRDMLGAAEKEIIRLGSRLNAMRSNLDAHREQSGDAQHGSTVPKRCVCRWYFRPQED